MWWNYLCGMFDFEGCLARSVEVATVTQRVVFADEHLENFSNKSSSDPYNDLVLPSRCLLGASQTSTELHCIS